MSDIRRDNHFVPQAHLKRWSEDGVSIYARRLLVSHHDVPQWERKRIRGIAVQRDL